MKRLFWSLSPALLLFGCSEDLCGDGENNPARLCFSLKAHLPAGVRPGSLATHDVNRDGFSDLIAASSGDGTVRVFLGRGGAEFRALPAIEGFTRPAGLSFGDLNQDGRPDLLLTDQGPETGASPDRLFFVENLGDELFSPRGAVVVENQPRALAVGDIDQDQALDAVVVGGLSAPLGVWLGNGDGTFKARAEAEGRATFSSVVLFDADQDGALDAAVSHADGDAVAVWLNDAKSLLAPRSLVALASGAAPAALLAIDLDGDGDRDLATVNPGDDTLSLLRNEGGAFELLRSVSVGRNPAGLTAGDFNGDGKRDLAVVNQDANAFVLLLGDGGFGFLLSQPFSTGQSPVGIVASDLNADGIDDLAVCHHAGGDISVFLSNP